MHADNLKSDDIRSRQDQVVLLPVLGEIFFGVVNDMVCANERTISRFLVLHTAVTSAPNALAICTANVPTPPDAPLIKTF